MSEPKEVPFEVVEAVGHVYRLRRLIKEAQEQLKKHDGVEAKVIQYMEDHGIEDVTLDIGLLSSDGDPERVKVNLIHSSTSKIMPSEVRRLLTVGEWKKVTRQVMDEGLLEDAMANGVFSSDTVRRIAQEAVDTKERAPYIKVGKVDKEADAEITGLTRAISRKRRSEAGKRLREVSEGAG